MHHWLELRHHTLPEGLEIQASVMNRPYQFFCLLVVIDRSGLGPEGLTFSLENFRGVGWEGRVEKFQRN